MQPHTYLQFAQPAIYPLAIYVKKEKETHTGKKKQAKLYSFTARATLIQMFSHSP